MMCYRDRTYCDAPCDARDCDRRITPEIEADAERVGMPLAISDFRDVCSKYLMPLDAAGERTGEEG